MAKYIKVNANDNDLEYEKINDSEVRFHRRWKKVYGAKWYGPGVDDYSHYHDTIEIPETVTDVKGEIGPKDKVYTVTELGTSGQDNGAFFWALRVQQVSVPGTVSVLYETTFAGCTNLHKVTLHEGLQIIEGFKEGTSSGAFRWCQNLHEIKIPDSVTKVGQCAFLMCKNLTEVTIGKNIKTLKKVFYSCHRIAKVTCRAIVPPELDGQSFENEVYANAELFVPRNSLELYKTSPYWQTFVHILPFDF